MLPITKAEWPDWEILLPDLVNFKINLVTKPTNSGHSTRRREEQQRKIIAEAEEAEKPHKIVNYADSRAEVVLASAKGQKLTTAAVDKEAGKSSLYPNPTRIEPEKDNITKKKKNENATVIKEEFKGQPINHLFRRETSFIEPHRELREEKAALIQPPREYREQGVPQRDFKDLSDFREKIIPRFKDPIKRRDLLPQRQQFFMGIEG